MYPEKFSSIRPVVKKLWPKQNYGISSIFPKNLECTRKKMWYGPQSKEMEAKPYFDARILVIHMKITIL